MTIDKETIAKLRELEARATPGEWFAGCYTGTADESARDVHTACFDAGDPSHLFSVGVEGDEDGASPAVTGNGPKSEANALLIAAMRNDLPTLLDEIERLREREQELMGAVRKYSDINYKLTMQAREGLDSSDAYALAHELEQENARLRESHAQLGKAFDDEVAKRFAWSDEKEALEQENARLREEIESFRDLTGADITQQKVDITCGDCGQRIIITARPRR